MSGAPAHPGAPFFESLGDRIGSNYLRYSFTRGTEQETGFLGSLLGLRPGARVLDVGCGPGRHAVALARAGAAVVGVDVSRRFLDLAAEAARAAGVGAGFFVVDARAMPFDDEFDAVISLQGAFGSMGDDDGLVLRRMAEATKPGGRVVVTAFDAYHAARHLDEGVLDADAGIVYERTRIRPEGADREEDADLWYGVYTPRELRLLAIGVGLAPEAVWSVAPGEYARRRPDGDHPELLLVARKPP